MNRRVDLWTPLFPGFVPFEILILQRNIQTRNHSYVKSEYGRLLHQSNKYMEKLTAGAIEVETLKHLVTMYIQDFSILYYNEEL